MKVPIPDSYWLEPGRLLAGEYPGHYDADVAREKLRSIVAAGIRSFVDLTETRDPLSPYESTLVDVAIELGADIRYARFPIRDMHIPSIERMREILDYVRGELDAGRPVYYHCWGGIGRTGTVTCCWMIEAHGVTCDAAFERIVELRRGIPDARVESPQTDSQREFVRRWIPTRGQP